MPIPINPYIAGDPVGNGPAFVGRDDVLRDVLKVLRSPSQNAITLFGQRRIGKTSMLQHLKNRLPQEGPYRAVYFDLQDKAAWPLPRLLAELARTIADSLGWPTPTLSMADTEPFRIWIKQRLDGFDDGQALALLFDEFDVLADPQTGSAAKEFFPYLRDLLSLNPARLQFVFVLGRNINDLSSVALSVFKGVPSKRVSLLNQAETFKLAQLSEQNGTLFWSEKAIETVWDLTHGHAYLTQAICAQVWDDVNDESLGEPLKVSLQKVKNAVNPALDTSRNMLEWLWNGLGPAEKVVSAALAGAGPVVVDESHLEHILHESGVRILIRELQNAPQLLEDWDILEPANGGYVFRVELLRRWIAKFHPLKRTQDELDRIQPAADSLFHAADALYQQGDLLRAEDLLIQAVAINPNHLRANERLAEILISKGYLSEAREILEKLFDLAPAITRPRLEQIYLKQADDAESDDVRFALLEKLSRFSPDVSRHSLVKIYLAKVDVETSDEKKLEWVEKALKVDINNQNALLVKTTIWNNRGNDLLSQEKFAEAIAVFQATGNPERVNEILAMLQERDINSQTKILDELIREKKFSDALSQAKILINKFPNEKIFLEKVTLSEIIKNLEYKIRMQNIELELKKILELKQHQRDVDALNQAKILVNKYPGEAIFLEKISLPEVIKNLEYKIRRQNIELELGKIREIERDRRYVEALDQAKILLEKYPKDDYYLSSIIKKIESDAKCYEKYNQALLAMKRGEYQNAIQPLISVIMENPNYEKATAYLHLAVKGEDIEWMKKGISHANEKNMAKASQEKESLRKEIENLKRQLTELQEWLESSKYQPVLSVTVEKGTQLWVDPQNSRWEHWLVKGSKLKLKQSINDVLRRIGTYGQYILVESEQGYIGYVMGNSVKFVE